MSKGYEKNKERKLQLSLFGKNLTRRSGSKCELCEISNAKLIIYELPPIPVEPQLDRCINLCENCYSEVNKPKDMNYLRCLVNSVWSEIPAVSALSIRLLRLIENNCDFAREILDSVYPNEETQRLLGD